MQLVSRPAYDVAMRRAKVPFHCKEMWLMDDPATDKSIPDRPPAARRVYAVPVLVRWGTLRDLTLAVGTGGVQDGGNQKGKKNTRAG
jgi:hypothetical protein